MQANRQGREMLATVTAEKADRRMDAEIKLCPRPESVRAARNFVRDHLTEWGYLAAADDASLIADELASNAIAAREGIEAWRGDACCVPPITAPASAPGGSENGGTHGCGCEPDYTHGCTR